MVYLADLVARGRGMGVTAGTLHACTREHR
jgi:hypothetical protein